MSFICFHCSKTFRQKVSLKDHIIKRICFIKKEHRCWCGKECISLPALKVHKSKFHSSRVKYETISLTFANVSEFSSWKEAIEEETLSKFVKVRGFSMLKNGSKKIKFVCHRSGKIRLKTGDRQRATRKKGSCKLNANCPAFIRMEEDMNGFVTAEYYGTHRNHKNEVQYLTLTRKERERIADDLNKGATIEEILEEIRNISANNECSTPKRIHMVTKADLTNIIKEFKITFKERLAKDITNVHSLVQECDKLYGENSPIKLFKPQNIEGIDGMEGASSEDFVFIIMTPTQKQMLTQYEYNQICIDSTHGTKGFDFHLTTILTINDSGVSLPVAFCISNVVNDNLMSLFFSTIMKECGTIRTSTFTSNDIPIFINSWCKVMGVPEKWQVDKELEQNLQTMKITTEHGSELDINIRSLMREIDEQVLTILLKKFVTKFFGHDSTREFGQFFEREYASPPSNLEVDYRRHAEIHSNLKLGAMLRVLKNVHFKNLKIRRIDFSIYRLLKMCWDNLFTRLVYLTNESDVYTLEILRDRHLSAVTIPCNNIIKNGQSYEILSQSDRNRTHFVEIENIDCSCQLRCTECNTCLHVYSCSCIDYDIAGNFCKHVHAVSMFEKNLSAPMNLECSDQEIGTQEEIVVSTGDIPSSTIEDEKSFNTDPKDELIKTLLHMTHLLQSNSYESNIYNEGAKFIEKALNLFSETGVPKLKKEESPNRLEKTQRDIFSPRVTKYDVSEITCVEPLADEFQVDAESQILVDDVVEEVVYVDVHTTYDPFS